MSPVPSPPTRFLRRCPPSPLARCFGVAVEPLFGYYACAANVAFFLLCGFDGSPTHQYIHRRLFPDDPRPPPDLRECCACGR